MFEQFYWISIITEEIGGDIPPTNMGLHALLVLQATEEDARIICATKVSMSHTGKDKEPRQKGNETTHHSLFLYL